jgi:hypothetical protein
MRTNARRGSHALTMVVLTAAVSLSGRVEAQQSGLFPLAPIRRQRVPCDREDPTYKIYKQQYFGYHPTNWRTFPPGWGCPSSEAPDRAKSLKLYRAGNEPEGPGPETMPGQDQRPPLNRRQDLPELRDRPPDPFVDPPAGGMPNALPPGNARPGAAPAGRTPAGREDPFREIPNQGASMSPSLNRSQSRSGQATPAEGTPELSAPANQPAQGSASRSRRDDPDDVTVTSNEDGPLLGLSVADATQTEDAGSGDDPQAAAAAPAAGSASAGNATAPAPAPAAKPRRRIFGNLFSGLGANWSRQ